MIWKLLALITLSRLAASTSSECQGSDELDIKYITKYEERCLIFEVNRMYTFDHAQNYCKDTYGGNLASVTSKPMNLFIRDFSGSFAGHTHITFWIGLRYDETSDTYSWEDGTPFSYTNLYRFFHDPSQRCVGIIAGTAVWTIEVCQEDQFVSEKKFRFICEFPAPETKTTITTTATTTRPPATTTTHSTTTINTKKTTTTTTQSPGTTTNAECPEEKPCDLNCGIDGYIVVTHTKAGCKECKCGTP